MSTVDSNFFRVLADNLDNAPAKEEPKPEVDAYALVKDQMTAMMKTCLELKTRSTASPPTSSTISSRRSITRAVRL